MGVSTSAAGRQADAVPVAAQPRVKPPASVPDRTIETPTSPPTQAERPATAERSSPGLIEIGVTVLLMPLTLPIMAMLAPVLWLAGSRPRR
jgi:hypothetical protein